MKTLRTSGCQDKYQKVVPFDDKLSSITRKQVFRHLSRSRTIRRILPRCITFSSLEPLAVRAYWHSDTPSSKVRFSLRLTLPNSLLIGIILGYTVTALARSAEKLDKHDRLTIVEGDVLAEADVVRAFAAKGVPVDAVIQTLNSRRTSDFPWAKFVGPARYIADSTALLAGGLHTQEQQPAAHKARLVVLSALGVGESHAVQPFLSRTIVEHSNILKTYNDHNAANDEIEKNCGKDVDFTVVMAAMLADDGNKPVKIFQATQKGASMSITRESVARWMVDVAAGKHGDEFSNKRVILSN
jgi:putative NADH-flavin reductase